MLPLLRAFEVSAGWHRVAFEGRNTAGASVTKGDNTCLIDSVVIVDPNE